MTLSRMDAATGCGPRSWEKRNGRIPDGALVLVDFGLARILNADASRTGGFSGTPVYSAPEQLRGDPELGPPADVYGLAVTLYECLALRRPFDGPTPSAVMHKHLKQPLEPPASLVNRDFFAHERHGLRGQLPHPVTVPS